MAELYTDEDFPLPVAAELQRLGHDVLTALQAGRTGQGIDDADHLAFATAHARAILSHNRRDFFRLHKTISQHSGIITCTRDDDVSALAARIHQAILSEVLLINKHIRITKPAVP